MPGIEPRAFTQSYTLGLPLGIILKQDLDKSLNCRAWAQSCDPLASAYWRYRLVGMYHHAQHMCHFKQNFLKGLCVHISYKETAQPHPAAGAIGYYI